MTNSQGIWQGTWTTAGTTITFPTFQNLSPSQPKDLIVEGDLILKGRVIRERSDMEELAEVVMQAKIDQLEARLAELEKRLEDK